MARQEDRAAADALREGAPQNGTGPPASSYTVTRRRSAIAGTLGVTVRTVTVSVRAPTVCDVVAAAVTVTSVVAPPSSSTISRVPVARFSTFDSSATVEPAATAKLVSVSVQRIPPGTAETAAGVID